MEDFLVSPEFANQIMERVLKPRLYRTPAARRMAEILSHVTYKPNVKLEVVELVEYIGVSDHIQVWLFANVQDSDNPENTIKVRSSILLTPEFANDMNEEQLLSFVFRMITDWEYHEAQEFFKVDGVKIYDPHK